MYNYIITKYDRNNNIVDIIPLESDTKMTIKSISNFIKCCFHTPIIKEERYYSNILKMFMYEYITKDNKYIVFKNIVK